jgi:hypothetical protein
MESIAMKRHVFFLATLAIGSSAAFGAPASGQTEAQADPSYGVKLPAGYRDWRVVSVAHETANFNSFAVVLGNDVAIKAYRAGTLPFPDGAIVLALHYKHTPSDENNKVFGQAQSFVAGPPTNIQFLVKDSKKYVATGGWAFAQFNAGKAVDPKSLGGCFACHKMASRDLVFTHYAP